MFFLLPRENLPRKSNRCTGKISMCSNKPPDISTLTDARLLPTPPLVSYYQFILIAGYENTINRYERVKPVDGWFLIAILTDRNRPVSTRGKKWNSLALPWVILAGRPGVK